MSQLKNVSWLSLSDYRHEWQMSSCFVLALAAVLTPMMVLFGLKFGIVNAMVNELVEDPHNREIRLVGSGRFDDNWFAQTRKLKGVGFVLPRTRSLAATVDLRNPAQGRIISAELIPTAKGDPVIPDQDQARPARIQPAATSPGTRNPDAGHPGPLPASQSGAQSGALSSVLLSREAARKLKIKAGESVDLSVVRRYQGKRQREHLRLRVAAIAPASAFNRAGVFAEIALLVAVEDFKDGKAVTALDWPGDKRDSDTPRHFPGFRLYTQSIDDVARVRDALEAQGLELRTRSAEIEVVQRLDRNLSLIFWLIALVASSGFALSLGASLWANVERKTRELSVLRLLGLGSREIIGFPVLQALFTAVLGWALASTLYALIEASINTLFPERAICTLLPVHYVVTLLITCLTAFLAALLGGLRAARIEPADGLREN